MMPMPEGELRAIVTGQTRFEGFTGCEGLQLLEFTRDPVREIVGWFRGVKGSIKPMNLPCHLAEPL
jgi:hypothetical protein